LSQNGTRLFGSYFGQSSFAQYALAAEDNVVVVDPSVDLTVAAPLGCGFQTGAGAVLRVLTPEPNSRLVVFGAGGVGLAAVMAAKAVGVESVVVVDPVASRRDKAVELGATQTVHPTTEDVATVSVVRRTRSTQQGFPRSSLPRWVCSNREGRWSWSVWVGGTRRSMSGI
jgi:aryl-alcohol dehydrogenase